MSRRRRFTIPRLIAVVIVVGAIGLPVGLSVQDEVARSRLRKIDAPAILLGLNDFETVGFDGDPTRIRLAAGRTFRLAYLLPPPKDVPEHALAVETLQQWCAVSSTRQRGLKVVGHAADGEALVELWGLGLPVALCGNTSVWRRRELLRPRWESLTWILVNSGNFRVAPDVNDAELLGWQDNAREDGKGIWGNPEALRIVLDRDALKRTLTQTKSFGDRSASEARIDAATLLCRANPKDALPLLKSITFDWSEQDVRLRAKAAQLMESAGDLSGTEAMMSILRDGGERYGLGDLSVQFIAMEYDFFWKVNAGGSSPEEVLRHYLTHIRE